MLRRKRRGIQPEEIERTVQGVGSLTEAASNVVASAAALRLNIRKRMLAYAAA